MIVNYSVKGMTCGGCVNSVKNTLSPYATYVEVTLEPPQATLTDPLLDLNALNATLSKTGNYRLIQVESTYDNHKAEILEPVVVLSENRINWVATYKPLLLIAAYILLVTLLIEYTHANFDFDRFMPNFMAGFFLVFSFFKFLNLQGFADSYAMYDLLAMRIKFYAYLYPFIELGLGIAYLLHWQPVFTHSLTLIVMIFSSLGVIRAVTNKQKIQCACLCAVFNLPMSTVTIIEDLLMAAMALWMLV